MTDSVSTREDALIAAAVEAIEVLRLCRTRTIDAPEDRIARDIGERIGYGALMSAASKEWAAANARAGMPPGAQHTCGPCEVTVQKTIAQLVDAISTYELEDDYA